MTNIDAKREQVIALAKLMDEVDRGAGELRSAIIGAIGDDAYEEYEQNGTAKITGSPPVLTSALLAPPLFARNQFVQSAADVIAERRFYAAPENAETTDRAAIRLQKQWVDINKLRAEWSAIDGATPKLLPQLESIIVPLGLGADGSGKSYSIPGAETFGAHNRGEGRIGKTLVVSGVLVLGGSLLTLALVKKRRSPRG